MLTYIIFCYLIKIISIFCPQCEISQCNVASRARFLLLFFPRVKKGTFVLPLQQHFCIIVFLVFWFYLTSAVGDLFHEALEFVISSLSLSLFTSSYFRVKGFSFLCISIVLPTCTTHYLTKIFTCVCDLYSVRKRERRFIQIYTSSFIVYASVDFCSLQSDVVSGLKKANKFSKIVSIFVMNKNK